MVLNCATGGATPGGRGRRDAAASRDSRATPHLSEDHLSRKKQKAKIWEETGKLCENKLEANCRRVPHGTKTSDRSIFNLEPRSKQRAMLFTRAQRTLTFAGPLLCEEELELKQEPKNHLRLVHIEIVGLTSQIVVVQQTTLTLLRAK